MIIDSSGKGRKVWKSEVIGPAAIVDTGSGPHVGSFRDDGTGSKQTNYTKFCSIQKLNNTIRVLIGLCKFWGPSCYIEYRGIRNHIIKGFYCTVNTKSISVLSLMRVFIMRIAVNTKSISVLSLLRVLIMRIAVNTKSISVRSLMRIASLSSYILQCS